MLASLGWLSVGPKSASSAGYTDVTAVRREKLAGCGVCTGVSVSKQESGLPNLLQTPPVSICAWSTRASPPRRSLLPIPSLSRGRAHSLFRSQPSFCTAVLNATFDTPFLRLESGKSPIFVVLRVGGRNGTAEGPTLTDFRQAFDNKPVLKIGPRAWPTLKMEALVGSGSRNDAIRGRRGVQSQQ